MEDNIDLAKKIRDFEINILKLYREGKVKGSIHLCIGQELKEVEVISYLRDSDIVCSNHRGHGHCLAFTKDFQGLKDELLGLSTGCCHGIGGSQHLYFHNFFTTGIQGGLIPVACGMAMAEKYNKTGNIVCVFIGDGTLGQGILYECLNIIKLWELPVLIVIENNQYAMSSSFKEMISNNISDRFKAFGWHETFFSKGWRKMLPCFHVVDTFRICGHSANDKQLYRSKEEIDDCIKKDDLKGYRINELMRLLRG